MSHHNLAQSFCSDAQGGIFSFHAYIEGVWYDEACVGIDELVLNLIRQTRLRVMHAIVSDVFKTIWDEISDRKLQTLTEREGPGDDAIRNRDWE